MYRPPPCREQTQPSLSTLFFSNVALDFFSTTLLKLPSGFPYSLSTIRWIRHPYMWFHLDYCPTLSLSHSCPHNFPTVFNSPPSPVNFRYFLVSGSALPVLRTTFRNPYPSLPRTVFFCPPKSKRFPSTLLLKFGSHLLSYFHLFDTPPTSRSKGMDPHTPHLRPGAPPLPTISLLPLAEIFPAETNHSKVLVPSARWTPLLPTVRLPSSSVSLVPVPLDITLYANPPVHSIGALLPFPLFAPQPGLFILTFLPLNRQFPPPQGN